eukprot:452073-Amorphochlora_amoeboformis.AAC.1
MAANDLWDPVATAVLVAGLLLVAICNGTVHMLRGCTNLRRQRRFKYNLETVSYVLSHHRDSTIFFLALCGIAVLQFLLNDNLIPNCCVTYFVAYALHWFANLLLYRVYLSQLKASDVNPDLYVSRTVISWCTHSLCLLSIAMALPPLFSQACETRKLDDSEVCFYAPTNRLEQLAPAIFTVTVSTVLVVMFFCAFLRNWRHYIIKKWSVVNLRRLICYSISALASLVGGILLVDGVLSESGRTNSHPPLIRAKCEQFRYDLGCHAAATAVAFSWEFGYLRNPKKDLKRRVSHSIYSTKDPRDADFRKGNADLESAHRHSGSVSRRDMSIVRLARQVINQMKETKEGSKIDLEDLGTPGAQKAASVALPESSCRSPGSTRPNTRRGSSSTMSANRVSLALPR